MSEASGGPRVEWPTLVALAGCYAVWAIATTWAAAVWLPLGMGLTILAIALHSSLCHEVLHGHPLPWQRVNEALVFPCLGLFIPYYRFRDTHLAHHRDSRLTDPYDDPESNYLDPAVWRKMPRVRRALYRANNTLLGRLVLGPGLGQVAFMVADWRAIRAGDRTVLAGWLWHVPAVAPVLAWLIWVGAMPFWAYLLSAYAGLSILKIRTFLEHRAHEHARGRTVIIEDNGPLAWLFLFNSLHVVHHMNPGMAWYRLRAHYEAHKARYLQMNEGYHYTSYGDIFRRYFLRAKDPVAHPLFPNR